MIVNVFLTILQQGLCYAIVALGHGIVVGTQSLMVYPVTK